MFILISVPFQAFLYCLYISYILQLCTVVTLEQKSGPTISKKIVRTNFGIKIIFSLLLRVSVKIQCLHIEIRFLLVITKRLSNDLLGKLNIFIPKAVYRAVIFNFLRSSNLFLTCKLETGLRILRIGGSLLNSIIRNK